MAPPTLTPGDKLPNFHLADTTGTARQFQGETDGRPILVAAIRSVADTGARAGDQYSVARVGSGHVGSPCWPQKGGFYSLGRVTPTSVTFLP